MWVKLIKVYLNHRIPINIKVMPPTLSVEVVGKDGFVYGAIPTVTYYHGHQKNSLSHTYHL